MRQRGSLVIVALLLSAFGPYIPGAGGVRVEHIVIYGLASVFAMRWMGRQKSRSGDSHACVIAVSMMLVTLWTAMVSFMAGRVLDSKVVSGLEHYLRPIALLVILTSVLSWNCVDARRLLRLAAMMTCAFLTLNSLVALATVFCDTWPFVQYFVGDISIFGQDGLPVWIYAANQGRYSGIFNQPLECGTAHSLGLLAWVYLDVSKRRANLVHALLLIGVCMGGFLSISKVFLLGGIPLAIFYWVWEGRLRAGALVALVGAILVMGALFALIAPDWIGFESLRRFSELSAVEDSGGALTHYTAGRFGADETGVQTAFALTWQQEPVQGFGFAPVEVDSGDNGYLEFFCQGGAVALFLYVVILGTIASAMLIGVRRGVPEGMLVGLLLTLIVGAGLGSPVVTINRASILLWVLLALSMSLCVPRTRQSGRSRLMQTAGTPAPVFRPVHSL
jgi:hypothetical protein